MWVLISMFGHWLPQGSKCWFSVFPPGNSRTVAISFLKMKEHLTVTVTVSHIELEMTVASLSAPRWTLQCIVAGMRVRNVLICAWQNSGAFWTLFTAKLLIYWYILLRTWSFVSLSCISEINLVLLLQFNSLNLFQHNLTPPPIFHFFSF